MSRNGVLGVDGISNGGSVGVDGIAIPIPWWGRWGGGGSGGKSAP